MQIFNLIYEYMKNMFGIQNNYIDCYHTMKLSFIYKSNK